MNVMKKIHKKHLADVPEKLKNKVRQDIQFKIRKSNLIAFGIDILITVLTLLAPKDEAN